MQIAKIVVAGGTRAIGLVEGDAVAVLAASDEFPTVSHILEAQDPAAAVRSLTGKGAHYQSLASTALAAPIDAQEVWAAGVTYRRSQAARMEESRGAAGFYDRVYMAARPELFFKATPHRVAGPGQSVRIRQDARWSVPEPELALVLNSRLELVGFTIGNDMSSRDIEGENPLYLPQAKVYEGCCALGPWITLAAAMPAPADIRIDMTIRRGHSIAFEGTTSVGQMARAFDDLVGWLGRDNSFPNGAFLLTGTGIVPGDDFTLASGDEVSISVTGIGTLANRVAQGSAS
jgi:2-dehydro-3-deoxy-D-arabinonate dehydratase